MASEAADEKTWVEKRSAPFREEVSDNVDEAEKSDDDDDCPDELQLEDDEGERVKVGRFEDLVAERADSLPPASLYRPSLLRKSWKQPWRRYLSTVAFTGLMLGNWTGKMRSAYRYAR